MKIYIPQPPTAVTLDDKLVAEVGRKWLQSLIGGDGWYINEKGRREHWTSWPHGSGTYTDGGKPSKVQKLAAQLQSALREEKIGDDK